ncbi:putative anti-sigma factor antagonist [Edaphobacter dinghuensis]|uniref:Anti-sigma factor antagonist n=2 Tax=Edaphobacter dinghuensis TaxID=1560005 RepID=A0A917M992_9BACT|nr:putative anti-sigma factor antagonist [Edaphobacter dinghuensis]
MLWQQNPILSAMQDRELSFSSFNGAKDGVLIVALDGPLLLGNMFDFQSALRDLKPPCLILDLSNVPYMDSAGLGVLMNYYVSAQNNHRELLVVGVNERIQALLEMTKVDKILRLYPSLEAAEAVS